MAINELKERDETSENVKFSRLEKQFKELLNLLRQRELPDKIIEMINEDIQELNSLALIGNDLRKLFKQKQTKILKLLEKELKIAPKNHYRNLWSGVGIAVFGIPIGFALYSIGGSNTAFYAGGIPIGMVIGMSVGSSMDKKAHKEGRQLDIIIKY